MTAHESDHPFGVSHWATTRDGRKLHYMMRTLDQVPESQSPANPVTVVFESGMGFSRNIWGLVSPAIGGCARAVVYDRAGLGHSQDSARRRTLNQLADDLSDLLSELGPGSYLLVGHSWGGPIVRTLAAREHHALVGLVLVDQSDEHWATDIRPDPVWQRTLMHWILPILAAVGLYRVFGARLSPGRRQPPPVASDHAHEDFTLRAARTLVLEDRAYTQQMQRLHARCPQLGAYPVVVISGTKSTRIPILGRLRRQLNRAHERTAACAPQGSYVQAPRSRHHVIFTDPQVIVDQIHQVLGHNQPSWVSAIRR